MSKTSSEVKHRYRKKAYSQVNIELPKDMVAAFKEKCAKDGVTQAGVIRSAIEQFLSEE